MTRTGFLQNEVSDYMVVVVVVVVAVVGASIDWKHLQRPRSYEICTVNSI